jgi:hypothetical protein
MSGLTCVLRTRRRDQPRPRKRVEGGSAIVPTLFDLVAGGVVIR